MSRRSSPPKGWLAHYRELMGVWAQRNSAPRDAEDAAHDVVVNLLKNGDAAVLDQKAYLYGASQNRLAGEFRRQRRNETVSLDALAEEDHPLLHDPESAIRTAQLMQALKLALSELPLKSQQVFLWNKIEGYTQEEIAQKLGLTQSMVEKHMKRALRHIQDKLQSYAPH
ncbi:RNA polymerase sigma factor [Pusillimonas noertemannii]|uniref:RNA polymerase sigma-70 factor (ECF subfamily) n=1 Tax=Pusillimonas noertemannii TaxID=305977 RepID=A0A2U1CM78_9BURK|nr:sigma-70 family RNA polymerase sigma factor [Pusillimonas noertemannii]NYT68860.1 sigma-70 family RNA polymerase sigma factor [Pusillimonas noertemannii]PVY62119.1 RNA polymerase sigma-70 factor (ECF subfamily) [Pusillimonas noertemannii]TFL10888.1 sigma-70 family RNA polymerase sigma factor [Pusillimonas noertemannii]